MKLPEFMMNEMNDALLEGRFYEEENLQQDKGNEKRNITDVAIQKIPFVLYPDMEYEDCKYVYHLLQKILQLSKEKNHNNEIAATVRVDKENFQSDEERTNIVFGEEHGVDLMADVKTYHLIESATSLTVINMHNHPNCSNFSLYDLAFLLKYPSVKWLILVTNKGNVSYLAKGKNYDRPQAFLLYRNAIKEVNGRAVENDRLLFDRMTSKEMDEAVRLFIRKARGVGIYFSYAANAEKTEEREDDYEKD